MRLGIASSLSNLSPHEWAEKLVSLGCKSVVFPVDSSAEDSLIDAYVKAAHEHDLLIAEVGVWRNAITENETERKENIAYSVRQLQLADAIGARCCVNITGAVGGLRWDGGYAENYSQKAWDLSVSMIQEVIDKAAPKNTFFSIEPMPWMIPSSPEEYLRLVEDVHRDKFGVHLDIINMINCPDRYFFADAFLEKTFELLGPHVKSCHLKDVQLLDEFTFQLRECACGEGSFPIQHYLDYASKIDPDMPMIIEHLKNDAAYESSTIFVRDHYQF